MSNIKQYLSKIALLAILFLSAINIQGQQTIIGPASVPAGVPVQYLGLGFSNGCNNSRVWTAPNGTIVAGQGTAIVTIVWNCSTNSSRLLECFLPGCSGWFNNYSDDHATKNVTVNSAIPPLSNITGPLTVCENSTTTYTAQQVPNASSYHWAVTGGTLLTTPNNGTTMTVQWDDVPATNGADLIGTLSVTPSSGCVGPTNTINVLVQNFKEIDIVVSPTTLPLCGGTQRTYTVDPVFPPLDPDVLHYNWTLPVGASINASSNPTGSSILVDFDPYALDGQITATPVYDCGNGTLGSIAVDVTVLPNPPAQIQGPVAVCEGETVNYHIDDVTNLYPTINPDDRYIWTVTGGTPGNAITSTPNLSVTWSPSGTGTITVQPQNECGFSPANSSLNVIVHPYNSGTVLKDSVGFDKFLLSSLSSDYLVFDHCETSHNCPNKTLDKATLVLKYNTGEDYNYGSNPFSTTVKAQIIGYPGLGNTGTPIISQIVNFNIDETNPEQVFLLDFTADYYQVQSFEIKILSYNGNAVVESDIQLTAQYLEEFLYNANSFNTPATPLVTLNSATQIANSNQYIFKWENSCADFINYEIQVLRLFNHNDNNISNPTVINADVDWGEALTIETQSSQTGITLTLAEGTGYYVWRVRPIGNFYEGGIGNDKNWGMWSNHSGYLQGATSVTGTSAPAFYYNQFNESINWIYSRTFTEGNLHEDKQVRISENITFANGLQQARQTQAHLSTNNKILTTQTVNDFSGRPALSSMPVPLKDSISLGFEPSFMKNASGTVYTAEDFDALSNYKNPGTVNDGVGEHFDYYSNNNNDITIPNAQQYPFTRTLFYNDGNSRVLEQSGVGPTFKINSNLSLSHTNKTFYSGVADAELIRVFGDEAPFNESIHKVINIDGNNTATVTYIGKDGKTLATCLAINGSNLLGGNDALMGLASQSTAVFNVNDTIDNTTPYGNYGNQATTSRTFVEQTTVILNYNLTPKSVQEICLDYCQTCDYYIEISVQDVQQPDSAYYFNSILLPPNICDSVNLLPFDTSATIILPPGTFIFTKRVVANNTDSTTITVLDSVGSTYFEIALDSVRNQYDSLIYGVGGQLEVINGFLDSSDITGLYGHLGIDVSIANADSIFQDSTINIAVGCDSLAIPIIVCTPKICPPQVSFAEYFDDFWSGSYTFSGVSGNNGFTHYSNAEFDQMIANMRGESPEYSCDSLWDCWYSAVQNYELIRDLMDPAINTGLAAQGITVSTYNIVDAFLDCAGRRIRHAELPANYVKEEAYKMFSYDGSDLTCENYFLGQYGNPAGCSAPDFTCFVDSTWTEFYLCVTSADPNPTSPAATLDPYIAAQEMMDTCELYCEEKKAGYIDAIINAYHQEQQYVAANPNLDPNGIYPFSGDTFVLEYDPYLNNYQFNDTLPLDQANTTFIAWETINCMADALVKNCKEGCVITPVFDNANPPNLVSMGTAQEIIDYGNSFTGAYEVSLPQPNAQGVLSCDTGWTTIVNNAGPNCDWSKVYGGSNEDVLYKVLPITTGAGGYLLIGSTKSNDGDIVGNQNPANYLKGFVVRIDLQGAIVWAKTYGLTRDDILLDGVELPMNDVSEFILGGRAYSSTNGKKYWALRIDGNGNTNWSRHYTITEDHQYQLTSINLDHEESDVVIGGIRESSQADWHMFRINRATGFPSSQIIQEGSYGFGLHDREYGLILTNEGYIATGYTKPTGSNTFTVIKFDFNFAPIWTRTFPASGLDEGVRLKELNNGNILVSGWSNSSTGVFTPNQGDYDMIAIELDASGATQWTKMYGGSHREGPRTPLELSDGNYLLTGFTNSNDGDITGNAGQYDYWITKVTPTGTIIWSEVFGGVKDEILATAVELPDNCFLLGGSSNSPNIHPQYHGGNDYWVLKHCEGGCCAFDDFCFRYVPWPAIPDSAPEILPISCQEAAANDIANAIEHVVYEYITDKVDAFEADYMNTCVDPDSINDNFWLTYPLGYHDYTLYYYNRAGSLIQTVPPQGVDLLDLDANNDVHDKIGMNRNTAPHHRFITDYEYNSLGQLIKQNTPDGGTSEFFYNGLGQLRFSQNAQQAADVTYSYTKYDKLGRIIEVGESVQAAAGGNFSLPVNVNTEDFPNLFANTSEVTYTVYNTPENVSYLNDNVTTQRFLQNRISYTYTDEDGDVNGTTNDQTYTYYSYDAHGNVEWLIQDIPGFVDKQYVRYEYDLVSGNVLKVCYNENKLDQFYHRYSYDADNRITIAETSTDNVIWDRDAGYDYYTHGPLQRTKIGEDKVQGLDYVYTIHGWLKALNHASLDMTLDPGQDGTNNFAKDVFAMQLSYFTGDFNRNNNNPFSSTNTATLNPAANRSLYNGNISAWTSNNMLHPLNPNDPATYPGLTAYNYRYDELNRIRTANFNEQVTSSSFISVTDYATSYLYDANGNLANLTRNGNTAGTNPLNMDNLYYRYYDGNGNIPTTPMRPATESNRLASVNDFVGSGNYDDDIDAQLLNNYDYDEIGNLIKDESEKIQEIKWTVYGKVKEIIRTPLSGKPNLKFIYDASGNRIAKVVIPDTSDPAQNTITWYSRDASGNVMAIYESVYTTNATGLTENIYLREQPIYGSSRVGERKEESLLIKTIDHPTNGNPTELPLVNINPSITENTNVLIGLQKPYTIVWPDTKWGWPYMLPRQGAKKEINFSTPSAPQLTVPNAHFWGLQGNNMCVAEDNNGNVVFSAFTARKIGWTNNVCRVLDANNNMMNMPLNNPIKSNWQGKSLAIKKPGSNTIYYLITVGTDKVPYYHEVDVATNTVNSTNIAIDASGNYGYGMALIEDNSGLVASQLFLRKYNGNGTASIVSFTIDATGISLANATIMAPFASNDAWGRGEMQISTDASQLAIANQKAFNGWWGSQGEIKLYNLNVSHNITGTPTTISLNPFSSITSIDYSPTSANIYYSKREMLMSFPPGPGGNGKSVRKVNLSSLQHATVISGKNGDVRRAKDGKIYVAENNQYDLKQIDNPDASYSVTNVTLATSPYKITGGLPLQPHKIGKLLTEENYTRVLKHKTYEINDHLGNVRAVISDVKESDLDASNNPINFTPDVKVTNNYYAFGSLQPNRHFSDADGYRYGFNGQEADNEVNGVTGSSYTAEYWQYDSRLGRRWNPDPITYPWQSTYATFNNNPITYSDPLGLYGKKRAERKQRRHKRKGYDVGEVYQSGTGKKDYGFVTTKTKNGEYAHDFGKRNIGKPDKRGTGLFSNPVYRMMKLNGVTDFGTGIHYNKNYVHKESQWMKDFNRVVNGSLTFAFAPAAIGIVGPSLIARQSFGLAATKTGTSALAQAFLTGKVNIIGAISDGLLIPGASDFAGAAFELNISTQGVSTRSILGTKNATEVAIEGSISLLFNMGLSGASSKYAPGSDAAEGALGLPTDIVKTQIQEKVK